jgi:hypothetical protein
MPFYFPFFLSLIYCKQLTQTPRLKDHVLLLFTQANLFKDKIQRLRNMNNFFPDYSGGDDYESASNFLCQHAAELVGEQNVSILFTLLLIFIVYFFRTSTLILFGTDMRFAILFLLVFDYHFST